MPQSSYFQQMVNRAQSANNRPVSEMPILQPTRPLFRQWEVSQPLRLEEESSLGQEQGVSPVVESVASLAGPPPDMPPPLQAQPAPTITRPVSIQRSDQPPQHPPVSHLSETTALSPSPVLPSTQLTAAEPMSEQTGDIEPPSLPPALTPTSPVSLPSTADAVQVPPGVPMNQPSEHTAGIRHRDVSIETPLPSPPFRLKQDDRQAFPVSQEHSEGALLQPGSQSTLRGVEPGYRQPLSPPVEKANSKESDRPSPPSLLPIPLPLTTSTAPPDRAPAHLPLQATLQPPPMRESVRSSRTELPDRWLEIEGRSQKNQGNTVHIGSIDIRIEPPPTVQPQASAPVQKTGPLPALSRGFMSSFGLRQG